MRLKQLKQQKKKLNRLSVKSSQTSSVIFDWRVTWGGSEYEHCFELVTDSSDDIYVVGATESYGAGNKDVKPILLHIFL